MPRPKDAPGTGAGGKQDTENNPGTLGLSQAAQLEALALCRDVYAGTRTMRAKADTYLPQFPKELDGDYAIRVASAVLFNATKRTAKGLTGMVFRKAPVPSDDVPDLIAEHLKNVDLAGRNATVFLRDGFEDKTVAGHGVIFVDWYDPGEARTRREEKSQEARPFWVWIPKDAILRAPTVSVDGKTVLTSFAYASDDVEQTGEFGERVVRRVRQYDLTEEAGAPRVNFRSWTWDGEDEGWIPEETGKLMGERMERIPVVGDYADRTGYLESEPPLEDLAHTNIRHFQVQSERDTAIHMTCSPVPVITGINPNEVDEVVGSSKHGLVLPEGADFKLVTPEGVGLEESGKEVDRLEQRMAVLGLSMLQRDTRAAETAESKRIDKGESDSRISSMAESTQDAANEALQLHATWLGLDEGGTIAINKDFESQLMTAQEMAEVRNMVREGVISLETGWEMLIAGERLPDSFDPELERERKEAEVGDDLMAVRAAMRGGQTGDDGGGDEGEPETEVAA